MFFILEISEAYLRRKDDEHLKYIEKPINDIDKQQNEMYGWRKYRSMSLSTFTSITSLQLFKKYLDDNKYDKALQIANMFKLNTDKAYQSQFNYLINQYNERNKLNDNQQEQNNNNDDGDKGNEQNERLYDNKLATEWIEILQKIDDELWIIDTLLNISLCNFNILDRLLNYGSKMVEHSEKLFDLRPDAYQQFIKYRERFKSLQHIMKEETDFDISIFMDDTDITTTTQFTNDERYKFKI